MNTTPADTDTHTHTQTQTCPRVYLYIKVTVCVWVGVSAMEIQTIGPILMKFGTVEDHDKVWFSCMFENWPSEAG